MEMNKEGRDGTTIDIKEVSEMSIRELLKTAAQEKWPQDVYERWLRYKEVQNLERIANSLTLEVKDERR